MSNLKFIDELKKMRDEAIATEKEEQTANQRFLELLKDNTEDYFENVVIPKFKQAMKNKSEELIYCTFMCIGDIRPNKKGKYIYDPLVSEDLLKFIKRYHDKYKICGIHTDVGDGFQSIIKYKPISLTYLFNLASEQGLKPDWDTIPITNTISDFWIWADLRPEKSNNSKKTK